MGRFWGWTPATGGAGAVLLPRGDGELVAHCMKVLVGLGCVSAVTAGTCLSPDVLLMSGPGWMSLFQSHPQLSFTRQPAGTCMSQAAASPCAHPWSHHCPSMDRLVWGQQPQGIGVGLVSPWFIWDHARCGVSVMAVLWVGSGLPLPCAGCKMAQLKPLC